MTSSGIKRGMAAAAISALAVAGIPSLASTADAAAGDAFTVTYTGPALNGGTDGALVVLRAKDNTIDPSKLELTSTTSATADSQNLGGDQLTSIVDYAVQNDAADSTYDLIKVYISATTPTTGQTATFRIFEDDSTTNGTLEASEARQTVSLTTTGALDHLTITPSTQTAPQGVDSGEYTVTAYDASGNVTQLPNGSQLNVTGAQTTETGPDTVVANDETMYAGDMATEETNQAKELPHEFGRGTDTFTAQSNTVGNNTITVTDASSGKSATTKLVTTESAELTSNDIDIVTAADTWDGPGDGCNDCTTYVRVDQNTIRIDINAGDDQANSFVHADVDGNGVTFGGQDKASYTTTLDSHGDGSITITVDAASIQEGDSFDLSMNGFLQTISFERASASEGTVDGEQNTYFCQVGGSCTVTAVVTDQFGNPVTSGFVEAYIYNGPNSDATLQRKPVGSDGTVDFTFVDKHATNNSVDNVEFDYYADQFSNNSINSGYTNIKWTTDGKGNDYVINFNGGSTENPNYKPSDVTIVPLYDAIADNEYDQYPWDYKPEVVTVTLDNCEDGQQFTVSADNGALVLTDGDNLLSEGASSGSAYCGDSVDVIGTKSGLVTVTVDSANRTETAQFTVAKQDDQASGRNVTVSGPATVPHGTNQITYTAVVTDAFGNGVDGYDSYCLNIQVSGPAVLQDTDVQTDADGMLNFTVKVDPDAAGDVTVTVTGRDDNFEWNCGQMGAKADREYASSSTDDAKGLPASSNVASATTTVEPATTPPTRTHPGISLKGQNNGAKADRLRTNGPKRTAGAVVTLQKKLANGNWKTIGTKTANQYGNAKFKVADKNGTEYTTYRAKYGKTALTYRAQSNNKAVR